MRSDTTTSDAYIVDGGALFNQPNWNPQCTYDQLLEQYLQYVTSRYSNNCSKVVVVFDGYDDIQPTKSVEHSRPSERVVVAPDIKIGNLQIKVLVKKNEILRNANNKKSFIKLLRKKFEDHGIETYQSHGDADVLIVGKAIQKDIYCSSR